MNEVVIQLCEQLKREAQSIIDCAKSNAEMIKSGSKDAVKTVAMFDDIAADGVGHCQKLVIALSDCFFQRPQQKEESEE